MGRVVAAAAASLLVGLLGAWLTRSPMLGLGRAEAATALAPATPTSAPTVAALGERSPSPTASVATRPAVAEVEVVPEPTRLVLDRLGVDVPVVPVGVTPDGVMELPDSPREAGWYRFGPAPTDPVGAVVISAHVDSIDSGMGPFASLRRAEPGDKVTVTVGGESRVYAVERAFRVAKGDLDTAALFARDGAPRLHLVTCGGQFDPASGHYDDNIVVVATAL